VASVTQHGRWGFWACAGRLRALDVMGDALYSGRADRLCNVLGEQAPGVARMENMESAVPGVRCPRLLWPGLHDPYGLTA
jgi:hypothetical protein